MYIFHHIWNDCIKKGGGHFFMCTASFSPNIFLYLLSLQVPFGALKCADSRMIDVLKHSKEEKTPFFREKEEELV